MVGTGPNWIDIVIVLAVSLGVVLGLSQGIVRQVMAMFALYVSTALASQYYRFFASGLADFFPDSLAAARNGIAMAVIFVVSFVVLNWLSYGMYPTTRFDTLVWLDQMGGAIFGLVWIVFVTGLGIAVTNYAISGLYSTWEPTRQGFEMLVAHSDLSGPVLWTLPLMYQVVSPWLPNGLPAPFLI
jgi:uncharacterized membrane protein required for colicin V production